MNDHSIRRLALAILALALGGCGAQFSGDTPASTMTEAQRDSAIARSQIPGSRAVASAFKFANKTSRLTVEADSLER